MPVWGIWQQEAFWFSSSGRSRKVSNLRHDPWCTVAADDARNPVIIEGVASIVKDRALIQFFLDQLNAKYQTDYGIDFLDPAVNATIEVRVRRAFALTEEDFTGSPTRWRFD